MQIENSEVGSPLATHLSSDENDNGGIDSNESTEPYGRRGEAGAEEKSPGCT